MEEINNIIHFICISPMEFKIYHYISVMSAFVHNPEKIYIYVDKEPQNNMFWDDIKKQEKIVIEKIEPPKVFRGIKIHHPQYQADIIRLEKLIERGGIYLDIDNMSLSSFEDLLKGNSLVMGMSYDGERLDAMSNSIILSKKQHPFLIEWYKQLDKFLYGNRPWAYHAVCLPRDIIRDTPELMAQVTLVDWAKKFRPEGLWKDKPYIFDETQNHRIRELDGYYTLVFYQTLFKDKYMKDITFESVMNENNIFSQLFKKYVKHLKKD